MPSRPHVASRPASHGTACTRHPRHRFEPTRPPRPCCRRTSADKPPPSAPATFTPSLPLVCRMLVLLHAPPIALTCSHTWTWKLTTTTTIDRGTYPGRQWMPRFWPPSRARWAVPCVSARMSFNGSSWQWGSSPPRPGAPRPTPRADWRTVGGSGRRRAGITLPSPSLLVAVKYPDLYV